MLNNLLPASVQVLLAWEWNRVIFPMFFQIFFEVFFSDREGGELEGEKEPILKILNHTTEENPPLPGYLMVK